MTLPADDPMEPSGRRIRRGMTLAALVWAGFAAYLSFIPFGFRSRSWADASALFAQALWEAPKATSPHDFGANVFFFVGVGVAFTGALAGGRRGWARAGMTMAALALALGLSVVLEFAQVFFPDRVVSGLDVLAAAVGSATGAAVWLVAGEVLARWHEAARSSRQGTGNPRRVDAAIWAYTGGFVLCGLLPFDFGPAPGGELARWRDPLQALPLTAGALLDSGWTMVAAVPLGALAAMLAARGGAARRRGPLPIVAAIGAILAVEFAQLFLRSRVADPVDVFCGAAGVLLGAAGWPSWRRSELASGGLPHRPRGVWGALLAWALAIAVYHWQPFDFEPAAFGLRLQETSLVPFNGYYHSDPFNAVRQFLIRVALAAPLGMLLARAWPGPEGRAAPPFVGVVLLAIFFCGVEAGQLALPTRTPDTGDALLGVVGAIIGMWVARR